MAGINSIISGGGQTGSSRGAGKSRGINDAINGRSDTGGGSRANNIIDGKADKTKRGGPDSNRINRAINGKQITNGSDLAKINSFLN